MRPIDGDALEEACKQLADKLRNEGHEADAQLLEALAAIVKFCPTLDVVLISTKNEGAAVDAN